MTRKASDVAVVLFLLVCLVLGGSSRGGYAANFLLQLMGAGFLGWALYHLKWRDLGLAERLLLVISGVGLLLVILQFVPLPMALWRQLPGRDQLALELDLLEALPDSGFITLSVHESLGSALWLVPALGLGMALLVKRALPMAALALTLIAISLVSIGIGLGQVAGGSDSWLYVYDFTTRGFMVGFFANANHMATLLLVTLPFIAALVRAFREQLPRNRVELTILGVILFAFVAIGVVLVGSMTGYALLGPAAISSALIVWQPRKGIAALGALAGLVLFGAGLALTGEQNTAFEAASASSLQGRAQITQDALPAAQDFFPVGSGLGTFEEVHRRYEDRSAISTTFINHAHNDYLELLIELGAGGVLLIILFLGWWLYCLQGLSRSPGAPFGWAGWISVGIMLVHSVWDYPLRTAALAAVFAVSCVLIARSARAHGPALTKPAK